MGNYLFPPADPALKLLEKKRRVIYAGMSGFIAGALCTVVLLYVNILLYPDLPIYVSPWSALTLGLFWVAGLSLFAGGSAYAAEGWVSIIISSVLMGTAILLLNFLQGTSNLFLNLVVLAGLLIPFTGMLMPIGYLFFWLADRFLYARDLAGWARWKILLANGFLILALGVLPGLYTKFNARAEEAVYLVHAMLQENKTVPAAQLPEPLLDVDGFMEHRAIPYALSQTASRASTVGIDVTAHYEDGYALRCTVVLYPKRPPYMPPCERVK